ncbi:hypothetical protein ACTJKQ_13210 [Acidovorax sp. 22279]|uniref:hypothetical protein n=1 Tax=Acidovorax sp. 22279 TaxID=3453900 RepID=UPI003F850D2B
MTNGTALTAIHRAALNLVTEAQRCGVVVTIETTPHQPLAMGNHDMSVSVREARRPPPFAADYSARLGTELLGIVATARAQAKRIIEGDGAPSDLAQDRRDLPETLQVIHHAVQHGLVSLTDPGSTDYAQELQALRKKVATYEARDALGRMHPPAGEPGPDGKEWAKTAAGYAHVEAMLPRADGQGRGPFWYGWALRGAFVAGAEWQEARGLQAGKPSWDSHTWPQIVQDSSGNWFGVREGWTMSMVGTFKGDELNLLREDGEFLQRGTPSPNWRTSLEQRPAASLAQDYAPLTIAEARDLTCMLAGAPWPDEMLPELQQLLGIYDGLRAHGQRPVDPATLPRKVAKEVMKTGLLPATEQQPTPSAAPAVVPPAAITASTMRDDGGEVPAFCLMAAYRTEAEVQAACALLGVSISTPQGGV